jgi:hypothetical protein
MTDWSIGPPTYTVESAWDTYILHTYVGGLAGSCVKNNAETRLQIIMIMAFTPSPSPLSF